MSMQYRNPQTKRVEGSFYSWRYKCTTCDREFENGEKRHEWRLLLSDQNKYHAGSFWTTHCERCFVNTLTKWRDLMNEKLNEVANDMGERI